MGQRVIDMPYWIRPEGWWLWPLGIALIIAVWRSPETASWHRLFDAHLLKPLLDDGSGGRRYFPLLALALAWTLAIAALAGPAWQKQQQALIQDSAPLVILLDLDQTMQAQDIAPTRLQQAKGKIEDILLRREQGLVGLIAYSEDPYVVAPLTDDRRTLQNLLPALSPDIMPKPGARPALAIKQALELLDNTGLAGGDLLLITDGASPAGLAAIPSALRGRTERLHILAVGTAQGAPVPGARGGFLQDASGQILIHQLPLSSLHSTAGQVGGSITALTLDDQDVDALLALTQRGQDWLSISERSGDLWYDQGHWLVLLLLPFALLAFRRGSVLVLLLFFGADEPMAQPAEQPPVPVWQRWLLTPDQQGQRMESRGDAMGAALTYQDPRRIGAAAYAAGDYALAEQAFAQGDTADDWYNRGNALAQQQRFEEAIAAYEESLAREPAREEAQRNIDLLQELLDEQAEQQGQSGDTDDEEQDADDTGDQSSASDSRNDSEAGQQQQDSDSAASESENDSSDQAEENEADSANEADDEQRPQAAEPDSAQPAETLGEDEREQAMEQWLMRIPDDPGGLLRRKFDYENRQRERDAQRRL